MSEFDWSGYEEYIAAKLSREARDLAWSDELVTRAIARVVYQGRTGIDWRLAPTDPGLDPWWRAKAK